MNEYSIVVDFQKGNIYTDLSILVQNDYNAYKLNFDFDKEFERALFKLKYPAENKEWVQDIVDNKLILPVLKDTGDYEYEISIYSEDGRLTGYATEKFHVRSELINTDEIVEPDDRVPVLDNLINETTQLKNETVVLKKEVEEAIEETNNLNIDVSDKVNKEVNITLTKKDNTTKRVTLKDGTSLMFNWDGTRLGIKTDEDEEYVYVDLIGRTGPMGPQGEAFQIKKTYANINLMIADYDNMQINDYVMIDGNIEQEDNAKLFVKQEIEDPTYRWHYLADFSGATGVQGPTGLTPNIQIGTVTSGNTPSVSRTGTNENPILNFVLQQGPQGEIGPTGETGETGNGILNIVKLSSIDNIDTYQINMTDGTNYQFTVTNSNVTNQEFNDLKNRYDSLINTLPKVKASGTDITLDNTSEYYMKSILNSTELTQDGTPTPDNPVDVNVIKGENNVKVENKNLLNFTFTNSFTKNGVTFTKNNDGSLTLNGTSTTTFSQVFNITNQVLNGNYTIKHNVLGGTTSTNSYLSIQKSPSGNISDRVYGGTTSSTFNITEDTTIITASLYITSGTTFTDYNVGSQLEIGSTATEYIGHQEQNYPISLSSKNLLNIIDFTGSRNNLDIKIENQQITIDGTATSGTYTWLIITKDNFYTRNGTPSASAIVDYANGTIISTGIVTKQKYFISGTSTVDFVISLYDENGSQVTTPIETTKIIAVAIYLGNGQTFDNYKFGIQLEEGSTATDYTPYIANPLEYCKIGNYADQISNQFESKNSFNIDDFVTQLATPFNVTNQDGVVTITRKTNPTYDYPLNCKENTQYTLSMDFLNTASDNYYIRFKYSDGSYSDIATLEGYADFTKITATSTTNKTLTAINFQLYGYNNNIKIKNIQLEEGSTATEYMPYGITKGEWYLKKKVLKIDSYNGEAITTPYISTTGGLDIGASVYYALATPTYIHISETDYPILRQQLENLYNNAKSYKGQTNITQTNDGLPFNIELSALRDLSTL